LEAHPELSEPTPPDREELAKAWLVKLIERTPLREIGGLEVGWIASEAPPLIADILAGLGEPAGATERELDRGERSRLARLARLRDGPDAPELIPRDLAALQRLMIESLRREVPEREAGDFAEAVGRLVEAFGTIQGAITRELVDQRSGDARDGLTGLPGPAQLEEWMRILLAENRRYKHPFAVARIDVDGLGRINDAFGRDAGDGMLSAVAGVIRRQVRSVDQAFRIGDDDFCVVAPHQEAGHLVPMAERLAELVTSSQLAEGPRLGIAVGIASCPGSGDSAERLLEAAEEASYAAKAAGRRVATAGDGGAPAVQDR